MTTGGRDKHGGNSCFHHLQSRLKVYASFVLLQKVMQEIVGQNKHDSAELKKQTVSTLWKYVQRSKKNTRKMRVTGSSVGLPVTLSWVLVQLDQGDVLPDLPPVRPAGSWTAPSLCVHSGLPGGTTGPIINTM